MKNGRRIAGELHDSAGQITVALGMNLTSMLAETKNLTPKAGKACREASELTAIVQGAAPPFSFTASATA